MINQKKLLQFYIEQYTGEGKKKPKKPPKYAGMEKKTEALRRTMRNARSFRMNIRNLEDLHRQIKNVTSFAIRKSRGQVISLIYDEFLPKLMQLDLDMLLEEQREGIDGEFLAYLRRAMPGSICQESLFTLYPKYRQHKVKDKI